MVFVLAIYDKITVTGNVYQCSWQPSANVTSSKLPVSSFEVAVQSKMELKFALLIYANEDNMRFANRTWML